MERSAAQIGEDDLDAIGREVLASSREFDFVITSGGIGPTHDDVTMNALARAYDSQLVRHPLLVQEIQRALGPHVNEVLLSMADVPEIAELVRDSVEQLLTIIRIQNVFCLPGEPTYFRTVFEAIRERFRGPRFHHHRIYTSLDEGALADRLREVQNAHTEVAIGSYPRFDRQDHRVLITIDSTSESATEAAYAELLERLPTGSVVRSS